MYVQLPELPEGKTGKREEEEEEGKEEKKKQGIISLVYPSSWEGNLHNLTKEENGQLSLFLIYIYVHTYGGISYVWASQSRFFSPGCHFLFFHHCPFLRMMQIPTLGLLSNNLFIYFILFCCSKSLPTLTKFFFFFFPLMILLVHSRKNSLPALGIYGSTYVHTYVRTWSKI